MGKRVPACNYILKVENELSVLLQRVLEFVKTSLERYYKMITVTQRKQILYI